MKKETFLASFISRTQKIFQLLQAEDAASTKTVGAGENTYR